MKINNYILEVMGTEYEDFPDDLLLDSEQVLDYLQSFLTNGRIIHQL
jgi:hypothetical protein